MAEYTIALDIMGGDDAPNCNLAGAKSALDEYKNIKLLLVGARAIIEDGMADRPDLMQRIDILEADDVISPEESPMLAVRRKGDSSMVQAMMAVREDKADAVVSAGPTGAVLACGMFKIGRIKGIERPALAPVIPLSDRPFMLIDSGANVDCHPKYLDQFGLMGSVYMNAVMGVDNPQVGLINIGTEAEKGSKLYQDAYKLMSSQSLYSFAGNCEAREIPLGKFDVIVADGFDGNVVLKYTEGIIKAFMNILKEELTSSLRTKIGAAMIMPALLSIKDKLSYRKMGGAPLLGVDGPVIKAHGNSNPLAIASAIGQAHKMLTGNVVGCIRDGLANSFDE